MEFVRDAFVRVRDFTFITGPRGIIPNPAKNRGFLADFDCLCGAPHAFTHLIRSVAYCSSVGCGCLWGAAAVRK